MRRSAALCSLIAVGCLVAAPSASALNWGTPATISAPGEVAPGETSVAMDAGGDAVAAWAGYHSAAYDCPCAVRAALRDAGGGFGAPVTIATPSAQGATGIRGVRAAMDAAGDAVVVWDATREKQLGQITGTVDEVFASVRPVGGPFGAAQLLSREGAHSDGGGAPAVAMDAAGDAIVAWTAGYGWFEDEPEPRLWVARRQGGVFGLSYSLAGTGSEGPGLEAFRLAMSPDGHAAIAFTDVAPVGCDPTPCDPFENGSVMQVRVATAASVGPFDTPVAVSPQVTNHSSTEGPAEEVGSVAIDDDADVVASYVETGSGSIFTATNAAHFLTSDGGGAFAATAGAPGAGESYAPEVAIDPSGESTATWLAGGALDVASRPRGGGFGAARTLGVEPWAGTLTTSANAAGANGDVLAGMLLEDGSSGEEQVAAALRPAGGSFGAAATVEQLPSGIHFDPYSLSGAIDASGEAAVLAWGEFQGADPGEEIPGAVRAALAGPGTPGGGGGSGPGSGAPTGSAPTPGTTGPARPGRRGGAGSSPDTKITKVRIKAAKRMAGFSFKGSGGSGRLRFQCKLDHARFKTCRSPRTYRKLKPGRHTFQVRAVDSSGAVDPTPARRKFKLKKGHGKGHHRKHRHGK